MLRVSLVNSALKPCTRYRSKASVLYARVISVRTMVSALLKLPPASSRIILAMTIDAVPVVMPVVRIFPIPTDTSPA